MPIDHAALKSEIQNDPVVIGYAPLVAAGNDAGIADLLNQVRVGTSITRSYVPIEDVLAAIVASEFDALLATDKAKVDQFVRGPRIKTSSANMRTTMAGLFGAATTTRANLIALATRNGSRAEQLWGEGTSVTHSDVARALRS